MLSNCNLPDFYFWTSSRSSLYFANEVLLRSFPHCISLMRFCYARQMISQCTVIKVAEDWVLCYDQPNQLHLFLVAIAQSLCI